MSDVTIFTWKIENFSCLKDGCLQSPSFETHSEHWELSICPADSEGYVDLKLKKLNTTPKFTLDCAIAFLDSGGSSLIWSEKKNCILGYDYEKEVDFRIPEPNFKNKINVIRIRNKKEGEFTGIKRYDVCGSMKSKFLVDDILIVECRMWFTDNLHLGPEKYFARTRFEPTPVKKKKQFVLDVNDVSSLAPNFILEHVEPMQGTESNGNSLTIRLFLNVREEFSVSVTPSLYRIHSNFKISLLDVNGIMVQFAHVEFEFNEKYKKESFDTNITKLMLMSYRNKFLSKETLSIVFECTLLYRISFSCLISENEYIAHNTQPIALARITPETKPKSVTPKIESTNNSHSPNNVYRALKDIYEEGFMSDFSLRVQDRTFPVHKVILGARSSVFRAMFTADMKEKEKGSVDIPDVDADTVQRMLKFVYYDSVQEDMEWESASSLYAVADKYALEPLKQRCSDILKSGLSVSSVIGTLMTADTHHDQDLKASALDFILENDNEIVGTEIWSKFAEEHIQLAFEAIQKLYIKKMVVQ